VLIVAIVALRNPRQASTQAGTPTTTTSRSPVPTSVSTPSSPSSSASSHRTSTSAKPTHTTPRVIGSQPLVVLNQAPAQNDVQQAAARFRAGGWQVTSTDQNYINDVITTTAYYDPSVTGAQAAALALQKQFPTIKRVQERFANLVAGPVVVVLTSDYSPS
jgi:hypothetical protein